MNSYMMYAPTRVLFGAGQLSRLHEQKLPGTKALLVISNGKSTRENGALERTLVRAVKDGSDMEARETMGGLFLADPCELDHDGCVDILKKSYR